MAKGLYEAKIATRAERRRLLAKEKPYWRGIDPDVHLGYRKGRRGGVWVVRWRASKAYCQRALGTADDELREGTLDFEQAVRAARSTVEAERRSERIEANCPGLSVRSSVISYIESRDAREAARRGRDVRSDARSRLELYVIGRPPRGNRRGVDPHSIADIPLHELSEENLVEWRASLPQVLKKTTKQRLINDFKAALNGAFVDNRKHLPANMGDMLAYGLRDMSNVNGENDDVARENQILSANEVSILIGAAEKVDRERGWEGDLFRMVVVLAATGARFSQITRMQVRDVQISRSRLMVPASRKGRGVKLSSTPVAVGDDVIDVLRTIVEGRAPGDILLERWLRKQVAGSIRWERSERGPWKAASEIDRPWDHIRQCARMPKVIPYAFRHSSIVRGIKANLPIRLVAALHDTSVAMIERHYGRYIADGLDDLAAAAVVPLVL